MPSKTEEAPGSCVFLFKGNPTTKKGYAFLSIPMKFMTEAVNRLFDFPRTLAIVVQVVNEEEFAQRDSKAQQDGFFTEIVSEGSANIFVTETMTGGIIDLSIRGFSKIYKQLAGISLREEDVVGRLKETVREVMDSVPSMKESGKGEPEGPLIYVGENRGVQVIFFTLIVKVKSVEEKYPGGFDQFIKDTTSREGGCVWEYDGTLMSTAAMSADDLDDLIVLLEQGGMGCRTPPIDFYVLEPGVQMSVDRSNPYARCHTLDDHQLEYVERDGKLLASLKRKGKQ